MFRIFLLPLIALSLCSLHASARKKTVLPAVSADSFARRANALGLVFRMNNSLVACPVKDTLGLEYAFAMSANRMLGTDYEIRYSVWPLREAAAAYDSCKKTPGCTMRDPNTLCRERAAAMIQTMSGDKESEIIPDTAQGASKAYNADESGQKTFKLSTDFTFSYLYGHVRYLHKENVADIVITELGNNPQQYVQLMLWAMYGLTFKP